MAERTRPRGSTGRETTTTKPRADAYVGLLAISLVLQIAGAVFLYLDYSQYPDAKPPDPKTSLSASPNPGGAPAPAPGPGPAPTPAPGPAPGAGMMGGAPKS